MVILIVYQEIEHHQAIYFPHFGHTVSQCSTYLKNMCVINTWQTIISTGNTGHADNMQLPIWRSVKALYSEIFILKQPRFRHFNSALLSKKRVTVFIHTDILRIPFCTELYQPLFIVVADEDFRSRSSRRASAILKFPDAFTSIIVTIQNPLGLQSQFLKICIVLPRSYAVIRTELQRSAPRRTNQRKAVQ